MISGGGLFECVASLLTADTPQLANRILPAADGHGSTSPLAMKEDTRAAPSRAPSTNLGLTASTAFSESQATSAEKPSVPSDAEIVDSAKPRPACVPELDLATMRSRNDAWAARLRGEPPPGTPSTAAQDNRAATAQARMSASQAAIAAAVAAEAGASEAARDLRLKRYRERQR